MKIKYLGTGTCEATPSLFCNCEVCKKARQFGGKEVRTRTGVLINDELMIDFSPDISANSVKYGINLSKIKDLLITHSHEDHFYVDDLVQRSQYNITNIGDGVEVLNVYANENVINQCRKRFIECEQENTVNLVCLQDRIPIFIDKYKVTPLATNHICSSKEQSLGFLIECTGNTYLHYYDSGEMLESCINYLEENNIKLDVLAIDCTYSVLKERYCGHLNFEQDVELVDKLRGKGIVMPHTKIVLSHISHLISHENLEQKCLGTDFIPAYDGMEILSNPVK